MKESQPKIGVGYRTGMLTVVHATEQRLQHYIVWQCRCDCGGEILLDTRCLQRGSVQDCGCCRRDVKPGQRDLTGQRFGKLVCIAPTELRGPSGGVVWRCQCDCGGECLAVSTQLTKGFKKSCGCLGHPPLKPWLGKRFGALTVIGYDGKRGGVHHWRCLCDCGNEIVTTQSNLKNGHTKSCGCRQKAVYQENLQLVDGTSVTALESRLRGGTIRSNSSGYNGVYYSSRTGKWSVQITFKGKTYFLGSYADIMDAVKARRKGEEMYENFLEWYYDVYRKGKSCAVV